MLKCLRLQLLSFPVLGALLLGACHTVERPVPEAPYLPRPVVELQRFELRQGDRSLGSAVLLEIRDPAAPVRFWRFQDRNGAVLGHASEQGRFSRRVPFVDSEEDLGIWPMAQGAAQLLDLDGEVLLLEIPVRAPAATPGVVR